MKRTVPLIGFAIFCLAAVCYGLTRAVMARHTRMLARDAMRFPSKPPALDATTRAILAGADRVETFRLADDEDRDFTPTEQAALSGPHTLSLDDHMVLQIGPPQGRAFASALGKAVAQADANGLVPQCFDPGVGFRVWRGKAHTDLCVCFHCTAVEVITKDAKHKIIYQSTSGLGTSRPAFLALSKQAFPQDTHLAALK